MLPVKRCYVHKETAVTTLWTCNRVDQIPTLINFQLHMIIFSIIRIHIENMWCRLNINGKYVMSTILYVCSLQLLEF